MSIYDYYKLYFYYYNGYNPIIRAIIDNKFQ